MEHSIKSGDSREKVEKLAENSKTVITDTSKSGKSSKNSGQKKPDISASTIISSIEREINELIQEINVRSQKNKLISITESIKILSRKIASGNVHSPSNSGEVNIKENSQFANVNSSFIRKESINLGASTRGGSLIVEESNLVKFQYEIEQMRKSYEIEIKNLKEEILSLQSKLNSNTIITEYDSKLVKSNESIAKLGAKLEQTNYLLADERSRNNQFLLQIKNLEDALKTLNSEYNNLSLKYGKLQTECESLEKTLSDLRKNNSDNKYKFEDLIKINSELKSKLIECENTLKLHTEDMKSILKKSAVQSKYVEELETKNKQIISDLNYKEERLRALRHMNSKLEQKSNQILKKFEAFRLFEQKSIEISQNSQKMMDIIDDLNKRLLQETFEKEAYKNNVENMTADNNKMSSEYEEMKKQFVSLKIMNEELVSKNNELEKKFKRSLEQRGGDVVQNTSTSVSKERQTVSNKGFHSSTLNNMNFNRQGEGYTQVREKSI